MKLFHIKIPDELAIELKRIAKEKGNTLSSEVRQRLYSSIENERGNPDSKE